MAGQLVIPPAYLDLDGPLIFLAGPIQGTSDWQSAAIQIIRQLAPEIHIANPRRELVNEKFDSDAQIEWDTHYLRRAAQEGAIYFGWLPRNFLSQGVLLLKPPASS
ncbi:MAG: nucleoside 2-deoxyribosyltransferase domain-containing protein [Gemmataceae bacterium]|nr:nucleoside 2-deoxyribosyltransferase domain-containing protein [Gemmataceae bacterium]